MWFTLREPLPKDIKAGNGVSAAAHDAILRCCADYRR